MITSQTQFCTGDELVFTCTLAVSGYDWVALPLLDGSSADNGRIALGDTETVGNFTLSASGTGSTRTSTLQVTAFPGLNGVNILCRDSGDPGINQSVDITVFGKASAVLELFVVGDILLLSLSLNYIFPFISAAHKSTYFY